MMDPMNSKQVQKSGSHSINLQGQNISLSTGLTYNDVREVALDVFQQNFHQLSGVAADTARLRAEEVTEKFLKELEARNPAGVEASGDPDFQYSLFTAQCEYARAGDQELGDILVDLLVDRTKEDKRTLLRIVLNESIRVAAQLTPGQIATLTVVFTLKYTRYLGMNSLNALKDYLQNRIVPFLNLLPNGNASIQHLEFTGCCSRSIGSVELEKILTERYPGVFSVGFSEDDVQNLTNVESRIRNLIRPCLRDSSKLQIDATDEESLKKKGESEGISDENIKKLMALDKKHRLKGEKLWKELEEMEPLTSVLRTKWKELHLGHLTLSSVGIAIGHANLRRVTGEGSPLSIWIN